MLIAMELPVLNEYTIITGETPGVDAEAERQALCSGTQLDVVDFFTLGVKQIP